jgi:hypothetical protein
MDTIKIKLPVSPEKWNPLKLIYDILYLCMYMYIFIYLHVRKWKMHIEFMSKIIIWDFFRGREQHVGCETAEC